MSHAILSIDIGVKNLGYTIFSYDNPPTSIVDYNISFGIFNITSNISKKDDTVSGRCKVIQRFFSTLSSTYTFDHIIIEKQVQTNTIAMELMYSIYSFSLTYTPSIYIFDPKLKFNYIHVPYDTKNKAHKKQSIEYATTTISTIYPDSLPSFLSNTKKDDISDSLLQGLTYISMNNLTEETHLSLRKLYNISDT